MQRRAGTFGHLVTDGGFGHEVFGLANYFGCRVGNPSVSDSDRVGPCKSQRWSLAKVSFSIVTAAFAVDGTATNLIAYLEIYPNREGPIIRTRADRRERRRPGAMGCPRPRRRRATRDKRAESDRPVLAISADEPCEPVPGAGDGVLLNGRPSPTPRTAESERCGSRSSMPSCSCSQASSGARPSAIRIDRAVLRDGALTCDLQVREAAIRCAPMQTIGQHRPTDIRACVRAMPANGWVCR